jgi:hypothetical protein
MVENGKPRGDQRRGSAAPAGLPLAGGAVTGWIPMQAIFWGIMMILVLGLFVTALARR